MYETIMKLRGTSSTTEKQKILNQNKDPNWLKYLVAMYDTMHHQYYVKKYNKEQPVGTTKFADSESKIYKLLEHLSARKLTGGSAISAVEQVRADLNAEGQELFDLLLGRDLKCGTGTTLINKVYGNIIPEFEVALAAKYDEKTSKVLRDGTFFISTKIDGLRCICMNVNGDWRFYSRAGNEITVLDNLKRDLEKLKVSDVVIDGEMCIVDENGKEDFQSIMKEIHKKDHTIEHPMLLAFDYLTVDEFLSGTSSKVLQGRLQALEDVLASEPSLTTIKKLEQVELTEESFATMITKANTEGWEGLILRKNTTYSNGRSKDMLKYKQMSDAEYVIEAVEAGEMNFTTPGVGTEKITCIRALKITHKGNGVSVGSGLSKEQRIEWYSDPSKIVGKTATIQYFEETTDQHGNKSLRFPVLKFVYENGRTV